MVKKALAISRPLVPAGRGRADDGGDDLLLVPIRRLMNNVSHDFVTVDMRGLKTALVVRARAERVGAQRCQRDMEGSRSASIREKAAMACVSATPRLVMR